MTLSILWISYTYPTHILYDCDEGRGILAGYQEELSKIKHLMEQTEQDKENTWHLERLKNEYLSILSAAGRSPEEANQFLKARMPGLFQ